MVKLKLVNAEELARFMHDRYEAHAIEFGWKTQKDCQVPYDVLPKENRQLMIAVANDVLNLIEARRKKMIVG